MHVARRLRDRCVGVCAGRRRHAGRERLEPSLDGRDGVVHRAVHDPAQHAAGGGCPAPAAIAGRGDAAPVQDGVLGRRDDDGAADVPVDPRARTTTSESVAAKPRRILMIGTPLRTMDPSRLGSRGRRDYGGRQASAREAALPSHRVVGHLTRGSMTDNCSQLATRRSIALEAGHVESRRNARTAASRVAELRASRDGSSWPPTPTAAGSSASCTTACSSTWSRSRSTCSSPSRRWTPIPPPRRRSSRRCRRDVQQALDETAQLAQRIYPPLLDDAAASPRPLRAAAVSAGVRPRSTSHAGAGYPPEVAADDLLVLSRGARAPRRSTATVTVRNEERAVAFEVGRGRCPADAARAAARPRRGARRPADDPVGARRRHPRSPARSRSRNDA